MADNSTNNNFSYGCFKGLDGGMEVEVSDFFDNLKERKLVKDDWTVDDFLKFSDGSSTNAKKIALKYNKAEIQKYMDEIQNDRPPIIKFGTEYCIPNSQIDEVQHVLASELFMEQKGGFKAFYSEFQKNFISDKNNEYVPWKRFVSEGEKGKIAPVVNVKPLNVRIWLYCRAEDKIYDISPWVESCSTNKDMSMGSFTLALSPVHDIDGKGVNFFSGGGGFSSSYNILDGTGRDWFSRKVQANDVVFIRYEVLKVEATSEMAKENTSNEDNRQIQKSALSANIIWDMIGLVDTVTASMNFQTSDYSVQIQGRDFMKLFVEDGTYFIPLITIEGSSDRWVYGGDPSSAWFKRNMITGSYDYVFAYQFQQIDFCLWFVINQLSNIGIVPDDLFAACAKQKEKLPFGYQYEDGNAVKGVWQMVQVLIDENLSDRRIVDRALANPEGTLQDLLNKFLQQPFVEWWGDCWGDGFDIIVRQPPFTESAIIDIFDSGTYRFIYPQYIISMNLSFDTRTYGWYRLMPQNTFLGGEQFSSLAWCPIIFLEEFVQHFGNKRYMINDVYFSAADFDTANGEENVNNMAQKLRNDMLYVVETTAYLPFTRRGTITIEGDRSIKAGTFVRVCPYDNLKGELFYVTAVQNNISFNGDKVDRTTVLTVERGMLCNNLKGKNSYFKIVNIDSLKNMLSNNGEQSPGTTLSIVDTNVFNYFLNRQQFDELNSII